MPGLHNLALMKLFGLLQVESGQPQAGKGWRIKMVKKLPFGEALMQTVIHAFFGEGTIWESEENAVISFGVLQPT